MTIDTLKPQADVPVADILADLQRVCCTVPSKQPPRSPAAANHSEEFLAHEQRMVFMREWICIGRADEFSAPGSYMTFEIAEVPILIVKQEDGELRAFVNACAHRFARLVAGEGGTTKRFTCPYHAWTYACDGRLVRAPYMEMKKDFDVSQHRLRDLHLEVWEGFVYVTLAQQPELTVRERLGKLKTDVVGRFDMACYRTIMRETMVWNANWKNLIENFTESYHVPIAHGKTFAQHNKPLDTYVCGDENDWFGYHRAAQPSDTGSGRSPPRQRPAGRRVAAHDGGFLRISKPPRDTDARLSLVDLGTTRRHRADASHMGRGHSARSLGGHPGRCT